MGLRKINRQIDLAYHRLSVKWLQVNHVPKLVGRKSFSLYFMMLKLFVVRVFFKICIFFRRKKDHRPEVEHQPASNSSSPIKLSISVLVLSKTKAGTIACLNSILEHSLEAQEIRVVGVLDVEPVNIPSVTFINGGQKWAQTIDGIVNELTTDFICFVSDEVVVERNWLYELRHTFDHFPALVACPKVCYDFGLLHNAGISLDSAQPQNRGQFDNPDHLAYNFITEVKGSNCCALVKRQHIPKKLPNQLHTFIFDICQQVIQVDGRHNVFYQPLAQVCTSSLTSDAFTPNGFPHKDPMPMELDKRKSILVIDAVLPMPDQDSGSRRLFEIMILFKKMGLDVYFLNHLGIRKEPYYQNLVNVGIKVFYSNVEKSGFHHELKKIAKQIDYMWISRPDMNDIYGGLIKNINPEIKWIYDTVDLHYLRLQRAYELRNATDVRTESAIASIKQKELKLAEKADLTLTVTGVEKILLEANGIRNVDVIPNVHLINKDNFIADNFEGRAGLIFIGSYDHEPNIDAVKWLVEEIMPIVWAQPNGKDIKVTLLGSRPTAEVLALRSEQVEVTGFIHDVSPFFLTARVFVAPLRFGAGMKGKIGQSLEFGLPIVSTAIGIEGMDLVGEEQVLIADEKTQFAAQILRLYHQHELWTTLRKNSYRSLLAYSPETVQASLTKILRQLD